MKTGKKVLGAVLAAAMALSSITPVFAADKVKITFMSRDSGDTPMAKVYEDQIAAFMEENPDIEVQNDSVYEESAPAQKKENLTAHLPPIEHQKCAWNNAFSKAFGTA